MTDGLIIDGRRYPVPGVRVVTYLDDPVRCPRVTKGNARPASAATAVMLHASRGRSGVVVPGSRESDKAAKLVRYQVRSERDASWCITIGSAGDVWQQCDAATFATWHATVANQWSVGLELAQTADTPDLTQAQVDACVAVVRVLCEALRIPLRVPVVGHDGDSWSVCNKPVRAWQSRKQGGEARAVSGVLGHRNVTTSRGKGDPGDGVFLALLASGFAGVAPEAMTVGGDRDLKPENITHDDAEEPHDDDAAANGGCVNDPASGEPDIFASVDPRQRGVTVRGDVAFAGAAVEVVTYSHGGEERAVVASSPAVVTEGRR